MPIIDSKYSQEYKDIAVSKCLKRGLEEVSNEFEVPIQTLNQWVLMYYANDSKAAKILSYEELQQENVWLKKDLKYYKDINQMLQRNHAYDPLEA